MDLVREKQLFDLGIDGKGQSLGDYAGFTIDLKSKKNQKTSNVTLKDTGDFYKSFITDYGSFELEIFATDDKTDALTQKYGENQDADHWAPEGIEIG